MKNSRPILLIGIACVLFIILAPVAVYLYMLWYYILSGAFEHPEADKALTQQAVAAGDYRICHEVDTGYNGSKATPRADCYRDVARATSDTGICDKWRVRWHLDRGECYSAAAEKSKDASACEHFDPSSWSAERCFTDVAKASGDMNACGRIAPELNQGYCFGHFVTADDNSACDRAVGPMNREICLSESLKFLEKGGITGTFCRATFTRADYLRDCLAKAGG